MILRAVSSNCIQQQIPDVYLKHRKFIPVHRHHKLNLRTGPHQAQKERGNSSAFQDDAQPQTPQFRTRIRDTLHRLAQRITKVRAHHCDFVGHLYPCHLEDRPVCDMTRSEYGI